MHLASILFQLLGLYGLSVWIGALPETAMGEGGDVAMGEGE